MAKFLGYKNIPEVIKFSYLKSVLSKDVQESIRALLITNENYSIALNVLRERYANKQVLISSCMENFFKIATYNIYEKYQWVKSNLRFC